MGIRIAHATPRVSLNEMIAAGPQPADSGMFSRSAFQSSSRLLLAADPPRRRVLVDRLAGIRQRAKARQERARQQAANLSSQDADFLRDIGAL